MRTLFELRGVNLLAEGTISMFIRSLFLLSLVASGATLTITPTVISSCVSGLGVATLTWSGATGNAQINVGQPKGEAFTGILGASGSADTGLWVSDGLTFYLVDQSGNVEASATAVVRCGNAVDQGLGAGSYFPLAVGNTWVYKYNDRIVTASYVVHTISGQQLINGQLYYVLTLTSPGPATTLALLRADPGGVVYQYINGGEQVYLDPKSAGIAAYSGALGKYNDAIVPPAQFLGGILLTTSIYARGIGLVNSQTVMETGSSGGFSEGLDLVDVQVNGFHLSMPAPKISLSIENATLDLTNQLAPNCALPCYFAACGLGSPVDPAGTYRPCAQTRIETSGPAGYAVLLELLDSGGKTVFQSSTQPGLASNLNYVRLPLYTGQTPFTLLPPGSYSLVGTMSLGGATLGSSSIAVQIQ
jgi:hypothetical protein